MSFVRGSRAFEPFEADPVFLNALPSTPFIPEERLNGNFLNSEENTDLPFIYRKYPEFYSNLLRSYAINNIPMSNSQRLRLFQLTTDVLRSINRLPTALKLYEIPSLTYDKKYIQGFGFPNQIQNFNIIEYTTQHNGTNYQIREVFLAFILQTHLMLQKNSRTRKEVSKISMELYFFHFVYHKNLLAAIHVITEPVLGRYSIVFRPHITLAKIISLSEKPNLTGPNMPRHIIKELVAAIVYLHDDLKINHNAVTSENVYISADGSVRLGMFYKVSRRKKLNVNGDMNCLAAVYMSMSHANRFNELEHLFLDEKLIHLKNHVKWQLSTFQSPELKFLSKCFEKDALASKTLADKFLIEAPYLQAELAKFVKAQNHEFFDDPPRSDVPIAMTMVPSRLITGNANLEVCLFPPKCGSYALIFTYINAADLDCLFRDITLIVDRFHKIYAKFRRTEFLVSDVLSIVATIYHLLAEFEGINNIQRELAWDEFSKMVELRHGHNILDRRRAMRVSVRVVSVNGMVIGLGPPELEFRYFKNVPGFCD